jgi:hypothetical protein
MAITTPVEVTTRLGLWESKIEEQIGRGDAKASTLLGWTGTALALGTTVLASGRWSGWAGIAGILSAAGLGALSACVVLLVLVIRPRTDGPVLFGSFVGVAGLRTRDVLDLAECADAEAEARARVEHLRVLGSIATRKYARVRTATGLLLIALILMGAGAITGALAGMGH